MIGRITVALVVLLLGAAGLEWGVRNLAGNRRALPVTGPAPAPSAPRLAVNAPPPAAASPSLPAAFPPAAAAAAPTAGCAPAPSFRTAAALNADTLRTAQWSAMGRTETGWEVYAPLVQHELGTACAPSETGFAQALSLWQGQNGLPPSGAMDAPTLKALDVLWLRRRPFVSATADGACPAPPQPFRIGLAAPSEGYMAKPVQLRTPALEAYRRLVAAARREVPSAAADPRLLTIFSGYRDPSEEAARCSDGGCGTAAKASCSAHRTGLAMDLFLGAAPGYAPESSADANRLFQSRTGVYAWLVANAGRFGFVPYPFEPWHWEWTGEPP